MSFSLHNMRITMRVQKERIAEVRDPETDELVDHIWAPYDEVFDLTPDVVSFKLRPDDLDSE